jgi:hypothetical protein
MMNEIKISGKQWVYLSSAAKLLHLYSGPVVSDLVRWLAEERNAAEDITVTEWVSGFWYITLKDSLVEMYPDNNLLGFTVSLERDTILWVNDCDTSDCPIHGNCFVRSDRWIRRLRKRFPGITFQRKDRAGLVHDYR